MVQIIPQQRGRDAQGAGYYGASRGDRLHQGVDFVGTPGEPVRAIVGGRVTKLGYPYTFEHVESLRERYGNDVPLYRYVQLTDSAGYAVRYFYVDPGVEAGNWIAAGDRIGTLQWLPYPDITQHYHFEVRTNRGGAVDPIRYLSGDV